MRSFEYEGKTFEYDETSFGLYDVIYGMARGTNDMDAWCYAVDLIFAGKSREYARALGGHAEEFAPLVRAAFEDASAASKQTKN